MNNALRLAAEPLRSIAAASMSGTYMGIGTALTNPSHDIIIYNLTTGLIGISFDGINDAAVLAYNSFVQFTLCQDEASPSSGLYIAEGQRIYVNFQNYTGAETGSVYLSTFYGVG